MVYIPAFNNGKWYVVAVDKNTAIYRKTPGYDAMIIYNGIVYNGNHIYNCEKGAWLYINKEYFESMKYEVKWK